VASEGPIQPYPTQGDEAAVVAAASAYANWGRRAFGLIIDSLLIFGVALIVVKLSGHQEPWTFIKFHKVGGRERLVRYGSKLLYVDAMIALLGFVYNTAFLASSWKATLGMRLVGVRIARAITRGSETDLGTVGLGRAAGRSAIYEGFAAIAFRVPLGVVLWLLDFLWPLWDRRNQTLHDKLAQTVVVDAR
jgi:uncharacterized RDD family membrane protein YckC